MCANTQSIKMTAHVTTELNSTLNVGTVENKYWGKRQEILYR